jgi:hypothetical protein
MMAAGTTKALVQIHLGPKEMCFTFQVALFPALRVYPGPASMSVMPPAAVHEIFQVVVAVPVNLDLFVSVPWRSEARAKQRRSCSKAGHGRD